MTEINTDPLQKVLASIGDNGGELIVCRSCTNPVTTCDNLFYIGQSYQFSFTNPAGINYPISCYKHAPGCAIAGLPTSKDSWFGGYQWQIASCCECNKHLGWYYQNTKERFFFGLIDHRVKVKQND